MRYLNKIIFINSAFIKYAEINTDGNVHFIGTQGVGKSTTLRAILFFYNADKQKLGLTREKKSFDEYYFPLPDSYVIYEIVRETGLYCVLAFKAQGRVCFRFIDAAYDRNYFIDPTGQAHEAWDKIREALGKHINYSRKIDRYSEYLDILYGNTLGIAAEFRKYALVESKQYQNIPRTIQNVFLNTKLDAEFIKQTIIMSLNEEDITIDLASYTHHLKDFETQLSDLKKWTEPSKNGEITVRKQATNVSSIYLSLQHLEREKAHLVGQLTWAIWAAEKNKPELSKIISREETAKNLLLRKSADIDKIFETRRNNIQKDINILDNNLKIAKDKFTYYEKLNIAGIIERVIKKPDLEVTRKHLTNEKEILSAQYAQITQKYIALLQGLGNQIKDFENSKTAQKLIIREEFQHFKETTNKAYETLREEIQHQHEAQLNAAGITVTEKNENLQQWKSSKLEAQHKHFFEKEIEQHKADLIKYKNAITKTE